jgi:hypothetical protein
MMSGRSRTCDDLRALRLGSDGGHSDTSSVGQPVRCKSPHEVHWRMNPPTVSFTALVAVALVRRTRSVGQRGRGKRSLVEVCEAPVDPGNLTSFAKTEVSCFTLRRRVRDVCVRGVPEGALCAGVAGVSRPQLAIIRILTCTAIELMCALSPPPFLRATSLLPECAEGCLTVCLRSRRRTHTTRPLSPLLARPRRSFTSPGGRGR